MAQSTAKSNWTFIYNGALGSRYHMARQRYFERYRRSITALSLIFSVGTMMAIASESESAKWLVSTVFILLVLDLVIDTGKRSRLHNELRQRYIRLEKSFIGIHEISNEEYAEYQSQLQAIEFDEPPIHRTALELCQNDVIHVFNTDKKGLVAVPWWKQTLAYFI